MLFSPKSECRMSCEAGQAGGPAGFLPMTSANATGLGAIRDNFF
jgi:hypothetical protein